MMKLHHLFCSYPDYSLSALHCKILLCVEMVDRCEVYINHTVFQSKIATCLSARQFHNSIVICYSSLSTTIQKLFII